MQEFYKALEERFRGSKENVKKKLTAYKPIIEKLDKNKKIIDIGCGRGEFLEFLYENGFKNICGVDINEEMTKEIKYKDIIIYIEDGVKFLKKQPAKSVGLISSFHMVEHIDFEKVIELIKESFRILDDEGILIIETPNPENIKVSSESFYLDYTHKKPIPMDLLKFAFEYVGLNAKILRLHKQQIGNTVKDLIEGVSPDYAVIGSKKELIDISDGISLDLAEYAFELRLQNIEDRIYKLENEYMIKTLKEQNEMLQQNIEILKNENESLKNNINRLKNEVDHYKALYEDVTNSKSWKITKPLREIKAYLKKLKNKKNIMLSPRAKEIYEALKREIK